MLECMPLSATQEGFLWFYVFWIRNPRRTKNIWRNTESNWNKRKDVLNCKKCRSTGLETIKNNGETHFRYTRTLTFFQHKKITENGSKRSIFCCYCHKANNFVVCRKNYSKQLKNVDFYRYLVSENFLFAEEVLDLGHIMKLTIYIFYIF